MRRGVRLGLVLAAGTLAVPAAAQIPPSGRAATAESQGRAQGCVLFFTEVGPMRRNGSQMLSIRFENRCAEPRWVRIGHQYRSAQRPYTQNMGAYAPNLTNGVRLAPGASSQTGQPGTSIFMGEGYGTGGRLWVIEGGIDRTTVWPDFGGCFTMERAQRPPPCPPVAGAFGQAG